MGSCNCSDVTLLWDVEADDHTGHLVREGSDREGTVVTYRCPGTGATWAADFAPDAQGIEAFRLTRLLRASELVAYLTTKADPVVSLAFTHEDIEFRPTNSSKTYKGTAEAKRWIKRAATDPEFPNALPVSVIEASQDEVLVLGSVAIRRGGYNEHRPAAWIVTVRDGKLMRSLWFDSWTEARAAAGLPAEGGPPGRRIGSWVHPMTWKRLFGRRPRLAALPR